MIPLRLQVKYFVENPEGVDLGALIGIFQRWIQIKALPTMLIDVADYRHVFQGPGVVLIGHESDFAMESAEGRLGLVHTRKRQRDDGLRSQLRASFELALAACQLLENARSFQRKPKFRSDEVEVRFVDRLQLPNRPESFEAVRDDLRAVLAEVYGETPVTFATVDQDSRHVFTVKVQAEGAPNVAALLDHLKAQAVTSG
jgi:hypothetical protein